MTDSKLVPADDEAFRLDDFFKVDVQIDGSERVVTDMWVGRGTLLVNLDISYSDEDGYKNTNIDMAPEDAERLGVLLQFAAREVMQRRAADA
jgi:hypothetical protein